MTALVIMSLWVSDGQVGAGGVANSSSPLYVQICELISHKGENCAYLQKDRQTDTGLLRCKDRWKVRDKTVLSLHLWFCSPFVWFWQDMSQYIDFRSWIDFITGQDTVRIVCRSVKPYGSSINATLLLPAAVFVANDANRFHPTVYVHSNDTSLSLLSACWRDKRITFSVISCRHLGLTAGDTEHISLFHICQLNERWSRDDPLPADWCHISWPTLKANCSPESASWDTSRTPSTFTVPPLMLMKDLLENIFLEKHCEMNIKEQTLKPSFFFRNNMKLGFTTKLWRHC